MRTLILSALLLLSLIAMVSCAEEDSASVNSEPAQSVYLKVEAVSVSSFDTTPNWAPPPQAEAATDGSLLTRWASNYADNQWICFDFGRPKVLNKTVIFWETAFAADYDLLGSLDNQNWQLLSSVKDTDGDVDVIKFSPTKARFVKLLSQKRANQNWGISLWEVLCFGPAEDNPGDQALSAVYPQLANQLDEQQVAAIDLEIEQPQPSPGALTLNEFQKGVVYTSWGKTELGTEASDKTLEYLKQLGVRHLGLMVVWFQDTIEEEQILPDAKDTPEDKALVHAINTAHSLGMKVMLKPHVDIKTDQWRGDIISSQAWFSSYRKFIMHYLRLAAQYNVEAFSIGTELVNLTMPRWQSQWQDLIKEARGVFSGKLTYSANWDEYQTVDFWDQLDYIGIDAYFPLTAKKDPTKEELIAAWQRHAQEIDNWLKKKRLNKPVIFSEIGYCSADGSNTQPWAELSNLSEGLIDQEEQAISLEAMLTVCSTYSWFKGFYWWNYFPQKRWSPLGYTIRGKGAEEVLANWLKKL